MRSRLGLLVVILTGFVFCLSAPAFAKDVDIVITDPILDGEVVITIKIGPNTKTVTVENIVAADDPETKAGKIAEALNFAGVLGSVVIGNPPNPPKVRIKTIAESAIVSFVDKGTGEDNQTLSSLGIGQGSLGYASLFDAGSTVTGGFFSGLGEISQTFDIQSDASGQDITQSFFGFFQSQNLLQIGITDIALIGGTIFADFNPSATLTGAGVIFGTTGSGFVSADLTLVPEPSTLFLLGSGIAAIAWRRYRSRRG